MRVSDLKAVVTKVRNNSIGCLRAGRKSRASMHDRRHRTVQKRKSLTYHGYIRLFACFGVFSRRLPELLTRLEPASSISYVSICCSLFAMNGSLVCRADSAHQYFPLLQSKDTLYVSHLKIRSNQFDIRFLGTIRG